MFQSPESGKFVSNCRMTKRLERGAKVFQSPRSGKFVSNDKKRVEVKEMKGGFQSPRSGKFVSDTYAIAIIALATVIIGFNPLDQGNLYLMLLIEKKIPKNGYVFQSPRSGKFVSNFFKKDLK